MVVTIWMIFFRFQPEDMKVLEQQPAPDLQKGLMNMTYTYEMTVCITK